MTKAIEVGFKKLSFWKRTLSIQDVKKSLREIVKKHTNDPQISNLAKIMICALANICEELGSDNIEQETFVECISYCLSSDQTLIDHRVRS